MNFFFNGGAATETLHEGYCQECCDENQRQLDAHNSAYAEWMTLTDVERQRRIDASVREHGFIVTR